MAQNVTRLKPASPVQLSKTEQFKQLLTSPQLEFIMEAHNGLSAKIVEETGFKGIWASGLTISSALGVRDSNEASWTQVLEVLEFMSDAASIPIMLDGDTGYGNFNNFRRLVNKLEQRGVAAVCIEDKLFPKTNSFIGSNQPLADIDEFCGKIKAGKDSQRDEDFSIVARVEALISGWGMDEALRRAEAYHEAGADAILIHSKKSTADEILSFTREWGDRCPVVIVPTTYASTPTQHFRDVGVSLIIWANHNLRSAINAMRETSRRIHEDESLHQVEDRVAALGDVFGLAGNKELSDAEDRYLASRGEVNAVVLAASRGNALRELTEEQPKCMLDIRGQPLLRRLTRSLNDAGVQNICVVAGYRADAIDLPNIDKVVNDRFEETGEVASLACAFDALEGECIVSYGDILFRNYMLNLLLESTDDITLVVDANWPAERAMAPKHTADLVRCSRPYVVEDLDGLPVHLQRVDAAIAPEEVDGEWVGLIKLSARGAELFRTEIGAMADDGVFETAGLPDLIDRLIDRGEKPTVLYVTGDWLDVNDAFDLARARNFT
ncbi:MAG: phosphoenolpyruvate mutase [Alphaproteobacteria bacterium]|nr:phosphoenolpyruvate mutase [Alphaproteobacteria bacterium]